MRRVSLYTLAGSLGGFLIWLFAEPIPWLTTDRPAGYAVDYLAMYALGALLGMGIGAALGGAEGFDRGSRKQALLNGLNGAFLGLVGGFLGIMLGQAIYGPWAGLSDTFLHSSGNGLNVALYPLAFASKIMARTVGWAFIGLFVGGALGLHPFAPRRVKSGLVGGLLGGALGGFAFEILAETVSLPELSRAIGFACVGAGTGLGVSLAQQIARRAWVRVMAGRNEGHDYLLDKESNVIGRDEMSDVPLFGDPSVGKVHAFIKRKNGVWFVQDAGSPAGTLVNGQPVRERPLQEADRIGISRFTLEFHQKGGQRILLAEKDAAPAPMTASVSNVCAFCGGAKNPLTGACACSPVAQPSMAASGGAAALAMSPPAGAKPAPATPTPGYALVALTGPRAGRRYPIHGSAQIGRLESAPVALPEDPSVSRKHATVTPGSGGLRLHDEGSSNGTFVNGARITDATLRPGDEVKVGDTAFRVEADNGG